GFGDICSSTFSGSGGRGFGFGGEEREAGPQPGTDLEYQVNVPFWSAIKGTVMKLNVNRQDTCAQCHGRGKVGAVGTCPNCKGSGQVTQMSGNMKFNMACPQCGGSGKAQAVCPRCGGNGVVSRTEPLEVRITAGTRDGQRLRLAGKGNAGTGSGPAGELYITGKLEQRPIFQRTGDG